MKLIEPVEIYVILSFAEGIPLGDSGSRKISTCYNVAKIYIAIVLFGPFKIPLSVLNPEESGCGMTSVSFKKTFLSDKSVIHLSRPTAPRLDVIADALRPLSC
jgi:hypothetical protein